jgi:hypothetical protein
MTHICGATLAMATVTATATADDAGREDVRVLYQELLQVIGSKR